MKMTSLLSRYSLFAALATLVVAGSARATVSLNFLECDLIDKPTISSDDSGILSGPYRLRAKFIDGSQYGFHAATSYQNNNMLLDSLPPPGTYGVALYYVTYTDYTYSTVASIGPENDVTVTVDNSYTGIYVWSAGGQPGGPYVGATAWADDNSMTAFSMTLRDVYGNHETFTGTMYSGNQFYISQKPSWIPGDSSNPTLTITLTATTSNGTSSKNISYRIDSGNTSTP